MRDVILTLDDDSVLDERDRGDSAAVDEIENRFHDKLRLIVLTFQLTSLTHYRGYNPKKTNRGGGMRDYPLHTDMNRRTEKNKKNKIYFVNSTFICIFAFMIRNNFDY